MTPRDCPTCGTECEPGARFCALCGRNLTAAAVPATSAWTARPGNLPVLRWGLYAIVGLLAVVGLTSLLTGGSRRTQPQALAAAASPTVNTEATVQARVAATLASAPKPAVAKVDAPAPTAAVPKPTATAIVVQPTATAIVVQPHSNGNCRPAHSNAGVVAEGR
jgi:hypothetical protein